MEASNGGVDLTMESVFIDGTEYSVRTEVADEIVNLRRGTVHEIIERIKTCTPEEDDTIIICVPANVSQEFQMQVGQITKAQFPDHRIAVLPEGLAFHTEEGLAELLQAGMEVATAVQDNSPERAREKADAFVELVQGRADESGDADGD